MKGFKEFLLRGNVIDSAAAVVIGAAFTDIINAIVRGVINPIVGLFGTKDRPPTGRASRARASRLPTARSPRASTPCGGEVLSAVLQFVTTAAVVRVVFTLPMIHFMAKRKTPEQEVLKAEGREVTLLSSPRSATRWFDRAERS